MSQGESMYKLFLTFSLISATIFTAIMDEEFYYQNNNWVRTTYLPARYSNYDLYNGYKVVLNERDPWLRNNVYRVRYAKYKGRHDQVVIRDSHDAKYQKHSSIININSPS